MRYFIHDPENNTWFYPDKASWEKAMADYDPKETYCDDGWSEDVESVIAGIIPSGIDRCDDQSSDQYEDEYDFYNKYSTHKMAQCNVIHKPDDLDEDDFSPSLGDHWNNCFDYICDYAFAPRKKREAP